jgi:predicted 2-oxoglutarate/Fe(II)-dependent dioxygenase YbiX
MISKHELPRGQIFVIDNVLNFDECRELINVIDERAMLKECYGKESNVQSTYIDLEMLKNSHEELHDKLYKMIFNSINRIVLTVGNISPIDITCIKSDSGYRLRKNHGPTKIHVDGTIEKSTGRARVASVIIALNSDYEGGEFVFQEQDVKIKLKAGQALFFPPDWSHPHETLDLHGTYRYTINTWLCH